MGQQALLGRWFPPLIFPTSARKVKAITIGLGGKIRRLDERCDLTAALDGLEFDMTAYIVKELGETEHGPLDAVVGSLTDGGVVYQARPPNR